MSSLNETAPKHMCYDKKYKQHKMSEIYIYFLIFILNFALFSSVLRTDLPTVFSCKLAKYVCNNDNKTRKTRFSVMNNA